MKKIFTTALIVVSLSIHVQSQDVASIGKFIPEETAHDWIANFKVKNPTVNTSHEIDKSMLMIMLTNAKTAGIYFYNALNQNRSTNVVAIPCDKDRCIEKLPSAVQEFQKVFPTRTQAQLLGRQMIQSLLEVPGCHAILVMNAIDNNGQERIVYVAIDESKNWLSSTGDQTMPCPPYCPKPNEQQFVVVSSINP